MPISAIDARRLGYEPYVLFGLSIEGLPIRRIYLSRAEPLQNPADFLLSTWRSTKSFRGLPDRLKVHSLIDEGWPALRGFLQDLGVKYEVANGRDKSFSVGLRHLQEEARNLGHAFHFNPSDARACLNEATATNDHLSLDAVKLRANRPEIRDTFDLLQERSIKHAPEDVIPPTMAAPNAAMFSIGQNNIAPIHAVCANAGSNLTWFLDRGRADEGFPLLIADAEALERGASQAEVLELRRCVKPLIDCWPGGTATAASAVSIAKTRMEAFLSGDGELDRVEMNRIQQFFSIDEDRRGYPEATGSYLLQARKAISVKAAYEMLSSGGDLQFSSELLPMRAAADPSWRFLLFWAHGQKPSLIMFPRGDKVTNLIEPTPQRLINMNDAVTVEDTFYRFIVRTAARGAMAPNSYAKVMAAITERLRQADLFLT